MLFIQKKFAPLLLSIVPTVILIVVVWDIHHSQQELVGKPVVKETVLGISSAQSHFQDILLTKMPTAKLTEPRATSTVIPSPTIVSIPTVAPQHEIRMVNYPTSLYVGATATFSWDVYGPAAQSGFIAIVGGSVSKPGILDTAISLGMTPYTVIVSDFTSGTYSVPLRFVGNAGAKDPGVYYFRALAFIDGKNIWSDEYSFTVK